MANIQSVQTILDTKSRTVFKAVRLNDGAGNDADLRILDASTLVDAATPGNELLSITSLLWTVGGPTAAKTLILEWDGSTDKEIITLNGNGVWNLTSLGLPSIPNDATNPTGDILLTTTGFVAGDGYTLLIECHKTTGYVHDNSSSSSSST